MKKSLVLLAVVGLVGALIVGCSGVKSKTTAMADDPPSVVVATPMVELSKTAKVVLYGTGFAPKQEVLFVFKDSGGVQTVISSDALKPAPVANDAGAWVTSWDCSSYLSLLQPGTLMVTVTDGEYKTLAEVPVAFTAPPKKPAPAEKPAEKPAAPAEKPKG